MLTREGEWSMGCLIRAHGQQCLLDLKGGEGIKGSASAKSNCVLWTGKDNSRMGCSLEKEGKVFSMQH